MLSMTCAFCRKSFYARPSDVAGGRKYCSRVCYQAVLASKIEARVARGVQRCSNCCQERALVDFYTQGSKPRARWCKFCRRTDERARRADYSLVRKFHSRYENDMSFRARELLRAIGKRCRANHLKFDLDLGWLVERLEAGRCELTGLPFNLSVASRRRNPFTPSIDWIAPGGGYTKDNCRVVLCAVNTARSDWGVEVFLPIAEALVSAQTKRSVA